MSELKTTEDCLNWLVENLPERFRKKGMSLGFVYFEVYCWTDWRRVQTGLKWERAWAEAALREWLREKEVFYTLEVVPYSDPVHGGCISILINGQSETIVPGIREPLIALVNAVKLALEEGIVKL